MTVKNSGFGFCFLFIKNKERKKNEKKEGIKRGQDGGQDRQEGGREGKDYQALRTQS